MGRFSMLVLAAAAGLSFGGAAAAQPGGPGGGPAFGLLEADANSDGQLTRAEFNAAQQARFSELDADRSGGVTEAELEAHMRARMDERRARIEQRLAQRGEEAPDKRGGPNPERMRARLQEGFSKQDANGDGAMSLAEFSARGEGMFARLDQDKNGVVTLAEIKSARADPPGR